MAQKHRKTVRPIFMHTTPGRLVIAGLMLVAIVGLTVGARALRTPASASVNLAATTTKTARSAQPQQRRPIAQMESELITITPHGFEPREITRPQGRFLLMVDNRSGLATTSLALTREAGARARAREMPVPRESPNWSDVVDLQPGRYVLTEAGHPRWSCRVTITAQ